MHLSRLLWLREDYNALEVVFEARNIREVVVSLWKGDTGENKLRRSRDVIRLGYGSLICT